MPRTGMVRSKCTTAHTCTGSGTRQACQYFVASFDARIGLSLIGLAIYRMTPPHQHAPTAALGWRRVRIWFCTLFIALYLLHFIYKKTPEDTCQDTDQFYTVCLLVLDCGCVFVTVGRIHHPWQRPPTRMPCLLVCLRFRAVRVRVRRGPTPKHQRRTIFGWCSTHMAHVGSRTPTPTPHPHPHSRARPPPHDVAFSTSIVLHVLPIFMMRPKWCFCARTVLQRKRNKKTRQGCA